MNLKYEIGQKAEQCMQIDDEAVRLFAQVTGDENPIHLDEAYARESRFGKRIAHGMLAAAGISNVIGTRFPGYGTVYVSQNLKFKAPVFIPETLTITVTVTDLDEEKKRMTLDTTVAREDGTVVISGEAVVIPPKWV